MAVENLLSRWPEDPRSSVDLFADALTADGNEALYWHCVSALQRRGGREVLEIAASLAFSAEPRERTLAVRTLAHLELTEEDQKSEAATVLLGVLALEGDPEVLVPLVGALDAAGSEKSDEHLLALSRHRDRKVRLEATYALALGEGDEVVARMIELTQDPDPRIRDWATFSLAKSAIDSDEIRRVLLYRTRDEDAEVRGEAMCGLAFRSDSRVIGPLLLELAGEPGRLPLVAAEMAADPRLYPALVRLQARGTCNPSALADALAACRPRRV